MLCERMFNMFNRENRSISGLNNRDPRFGGKSTLIILFIIATFISSSSASADGGIGTTYNLVPNLVVDLYAAWQSGQVEKARQIQFQIDRIILVIRQFGVIPAVKAALRLRGLDCGGTRAPLLPLSDQAFEHLVDELEQAGLASLMRSP
jgi:dihydrodipicolinate synthase/N-acetylneuraminate lyase